MPPYKQCTQGDATALFEALPVFAQVVRPRGDGHPRMAELLSRCQYRLFRDGATVTFCEDDVVLGGIVWLWDYVAQGMTRAAAVADIELTVDRVWLDGEEQVLERTAYKDVDSPTLGLTVFQHRAFRRTLAPGDHVSRWVSTYPGLSDETATVTLHVMPHALCT